MDEFRKIVQGYIRKLESEYKREMPKEIIHIIILFCAKINYIGHFLKENASPRIVIGPEQLTISGRQSAKLDKALPAFLEDSDATSIWRWRAKVSIPSPSIASYGYCLIFGVVSNQCTTFPTYPDDYLIDSYGISITPNYVFRGTNYMKRTENDYKGFNSNDIIRMEYEVTSTNKCKLSFYNETEDNEFMYQMDLPNNDKIQNWYPVFSLYDWTEGYIKVIPY